MSSLLARLNLIFSSFGAPVAGSPTVVSRGWSVERISEPNTVLALALLSSRPNELKGGAFYGTNFLIGTGQVSAIDNDGIPIALVQGNLDGVATPDNALRTYSQIQDPPKAFITVNGANHYGITNEDNLIRESIRPTLEQSVATETIARWSALFLRGTVLNDTEALNYVFNTGDALDKNVSVKSLAKPIPEPASIMSLLGLGTVGTVMLWHKQKLVKKKTAIR